MEPKTPPYESRFQSQNSSPSSSSSAARLWRPAAQRNLRNQWSNLNSLRQDWRSAASAARSHATAIVNAYLSQKYMDGMDLGVLSDMPDIRTRACCKLRKQQELYKCKLLSSYKEMVKYEFHFLVLSKLVNSILDACYTSDSVPVALVTRMVKTCKSMRWYFRGTSNSPLVQFSFTSEDDSDSGDCGGIPVFTFYSIASFEELAWEVVQMFISELNLKRLLVMEFLSAYDEKVAKVKRLQWSDELYDGEFNDLSLFNLYSKETPEQETPEPVQPVLPCLASCKSSTSSMEFKQQQDRNVLQVYLTTWLVEVNIDRFRMDEIFASVGSEIRVDFLETFS